MTFFRTCCCSEDVGPRVLCLCSWSLIYSHASGAHQLGTTVLDKAHLAVLNTNSLSNTGGNQNHRCAKTEITKCEDKDKKRGKHATTLMCAHRAGVQSCEVRPYIYIYINNPMYFDYGKHAITFLSAFNVCRVMQARRWCTTINCMVSSSTNIGTIVPTYRRFLISASTWTGLPKPCEKTLNWAVKVS